MKNTERGNRFRKKGRSVKSILTLLLVFTFAFVSCTGDDSGGDNDDAGRSGLENADSWLYQLQNVDPGRVSDSGFDIIVTDYSEDGTAAGEWSHGDVSRMKEGGRIALCYLSIGEAEDYRWYWEEDWEDDPPGWLGEEEIWAGLSSPQPWR